MATLRISSGFVSGIRMRAQAGLIESMDAMRVLTMLAVIQIHMH